MLLFTNLGSNLVFSGIEYFTYLNLWLVSLLFLMIVVFLILCSSLLLHSTIDLNDTWMEFFLTLFSLWFLWMIISPSLIILLDFDLISLPSFVIYSLGYQWAWSFSLFSSHFPALNHSFTFDHYAISSFSQSNSRPLAMPFSFYLFDINRFLIFPSWSSFKIFVFTFDVIHSIGFYSFGIKIDAIPGRINLASTLQCLFKGEHRGFCFELCGQGHSSMVVAGIMLNVKWP